MNALNSAPYESETKVVSETCLTARGAARLVWNDKAMTLRKEGSRTIVAFKWESCIASGEAKVVIWRAAVNGIAT